MHISFSVQESTWLEQKVHVVHQGHLESVAAALSVALHLMIMHPQQTIWKYQRWGMSRLVEVQRKPWESSDASLKPRSNMKIYSSLLLFFILKKRMGMYILKLYDVMQASFLFFILELE